MEPELQPTNPGQCRPDEHRLHRRLFLKGLTGGALATVSSFTGLFHNPVFAAETKKAQKHCILLWLCGAPSQFETWDPKPGRPSGGPFPSIPTKIPGVHFSSLMPLCASMADKLNIVRSMKTKESEHLQAITLLQRGNPERAGFTRPTLGSALSHALGQLDSPIPNFVFIDPIPGGNEFESFKAGNWAGWLGAEHAPVRIGAITRRSPTPRRTRFRSMIARRARRSESFSPRNSSATAKAASRAVRTPRSSA